LVGVATEIFECFNAIFRYCSIFSNHLAPSRDIAIALASQEHIKYVLTGGFYRTQSGEWKQSGDRLPGLIREHPVLQQMLGWTDHTLRPPGTVKIKTKKTHGHNYEAEQIIPQQTDAQGAINLAQIGLDLSVDWMKCKYIIAESGDEYRAGDWVFATSPVTDMIIPGQIIAILTRNSPIILLDEFEIQTQRHPLFNMPVLLRRDPQKKRVVIVPASKLKFIINVQHDCPSEGCTDSGRRPRQQEREDTDIDESFIQHNGLTRFVLNNSAVHNTHLRH
jgi:hypothetical protein